MGFLNQLSYLGGPTLYEFDDQFLFLFLDPDRKFRPIPDLLVFHTCCSTEKSILRSRLKRWSEQWSSCFDTKKNHQSVGIWGSQKPSYYIYIYIPNIVIGKNLAVFQAESDQFENGSWSGQTSGFPILRIVDQYLGVSVVCWFMTLSNYSYRHHKP